MWGQLTVACHPSSLVICCCPLASVGAFSHTHIPTYKHKQVIVLKKKNEIYKTRENQCKGESHCTKRENMGRKRVKKKRVESEVLQTTGALSMPWPLLLAFRRLPFVLKGWTQCFKSIFQDFLPKRKKILTVVGCAALPSSFCWLVREAVSEFSIIKSVTLSAVTQIWLYHKMLFANFLLH